MGAWTILIEPWPASSSIPLKAALEVDPRRKIARLCARVEGSDNLEVQSGAIARSFFETEARDFSKAGEWLKEPEATELLERIHAGYHCDTLWSGDPVASWSEDAWEAGHQLYQKLSILV
jgi:hypothetical protein